MTEDRGHGTEDKDERESGPGSTDIKGEKTIGEILLGARERSGLNLDAVSLETKIPRRSLEYLETDNYDALPAKVYVRGFLRTYARVLGLDVQHILDRYEVQTGQTHKSLGDHWEIEEEVIEEKLAAPHIFKRFVLPAIGLAAAVVIIVWFLSGREGSIEPPRDLPEGVVSEEADGNQAETGDGQEVSEQRSGQEAEASRQRDEAPDREEETEEEAPPPQAAAEAAVAVEEKAEDPMEIRIIATEQDTTWFDMVVYTTVNSRPDSIFRDFILYPGQVRTFRATDSIFFRTIGNAGGFTIELNGERLPSLGGRKKVIKSVRITREGVR